MQREPICKNKMLLNSNRTLGRKTSLDFNKFKKTFFLFGGDVDNA